ncbi:hypothetical protein KXV64_002551 [Aspergillus fumigatus]|nr:hypothetical protein KXV47_006351 [Aspergillus fumigatus]KAH2749377.1 hypothetical protein KXV94_003662 [Aspergillus fumigatus]KAH3530511.1 hypothetical protein KXV64_002551 [Aspergillus fumigatus]
MTLTTLLATLTPHNAQTELKPTPIYAPESVPRIKNAKRLSTTRWKQLVRAAAREHDDPPPPPGLGECCGSSCDPCVTDLWREELACWRERWGSAVEDRKGEAVGERTQRRGRKEINIGGVNSGCRGVLIGSIAVYCTICKKD